jgi:hypothetical protein
MDAYEKITLEYLSNGWGFKTIEEAFQMEILNHVLEIDKKEVIVTFISDLLRVGDNCVDNWRIFPANMIDEYNEVQITGCCGFYDSKYSCVSGNSYLLGFNYGH